MNRFTCDVEEATFDERVIARSDALPVVLDIGAAWCGPCRVLTPMLEKLALAYQGQFLLARVDADENMRIAGRHQAKGFPTVIAYSHGQVTDRFHGAQTERFLREFLDRLITSHQALSTVDQHALPISTNYTI
ncbi:MAG: thioredoxin [Burkholderiales bacterium]|jgi:putative thioredoxin|nr:thioredoxin [Burkholderiales bacterium]